MNVLDGTPILLIVTWVLFSCCEVHSLEDPVQKQSNLYQHCLKTCTNEDENSEKLQDSQDESECLRQCLLSNKGNVTSTYFQARHISTTKHLLRSTTAGIKPDRRNDCPEADDLKARPNERIPGEVSALAVTFAQGKQPGIGQHWIASATWMVPKGVNRTMNWRGYLVIWNFETETTEEAHEGYMVNCKMLPKNQTNLNIKEKNGDKYLVGIYITVIALPTDKDVFELSHFAPALRDLQMTYFQPHHDKDQFQVQSPKGIAVILFSGLTFCLIFVGVLNICVKRKNLSGYDTKIMPRPGKTEKETRKNLDGQEDQLIA